MDGNEDDTLLIYTTLETAHDASDLGSSLVDSRLAACVNIIPGMQSIYQWEGKRCEASEVVMIVKTRRKCLEAALKHMNSTHPYDTPALIVIDPLTVSENFATWIVQQTGSE